MGENTVQTEKAPKKSWFQGFKSEFKKIVWPTKESMAKQSVAVVIVTVILGIIIAAVDVGVKYGFDKLLQLG